MANILLITADDLAKTFNGELDETKADWYQEKIDEVTRRVIHDYPSLLNRIALEKIDPLLVKQTILAVVSRIVRAGEGDLKSEGLGNYNYTVNFRDANVNIYLLPDERKVFAPKSGKPRVRTSRVTLGTGWGI